MKRLLLFEEEPIIRNLLEKSKTVDNFSIISTSNLQDTLQAIEEQNPEILVMTEDIKGIEPLTFCKNLREDKFSSLPILLVINFYSSLSLEDLKDLNVDFILKPFTAEEFNEKVSEILLKHEEPVSVTAFKLSDYEIIDKIKPYIKEEVRKELIKILKLFLEEMEQKYA